MKQEPQVLYIPMGVKPEAEWFPGFGKQQLAQAILGSTIAVALAVLLWFIKGSVPLAVVTFLTGVSASIMMTTKDRNNLSVLDQVRFMIRFMKTQKVYPYRAMAEWHWKEQKKP
ncbi:hypothetical protein SAMN04487895_11745 [Paenibacillus sophorae]|uniref:PrgI family protein n=1 Tax=Paenibacillus sophorae TaxID=1333845 RepID=A0A1H8UDE9_9BACL|nr:hypothetical protein [Paenibacillus sophorae]QWU13173.1 hypothetical protein KP014_14205 [Paenibacillus sophorae]SEP01225.1 hypothetical protein SAMN04487895_11745 [Paenibacillus sophorae]